MEVPIALNNRDPPSALMSLSGVLFRHQPSGLRPIDDIGRDLSDDAAQDAACRPDQYPAINVRGPADVHAQEFPLLLAKKPEGGDLCIADDWLHQIEQLPVAEEA